MINRILPFPQNKIQQTNPKPLYNNFITQSRNNKMHYQKFSTHSPSASPQPLAIAPVSPDQKISLFCSDNSPVLPSKFIFDNTYRNMNQKKKFQRDPKYAYFNAILKLKTNFIKGKKREVYEQLFKDREKDGQWMDSGQEMSEIARNRQILTRQAQLRTPRKTFHVQRINNHSFKIYKDKKTLATSSNSLIEDLSSPNLNFNVHFRPPNSREQQKQKQPKITQLLSEYRKLQTFKSKYNPQKFANNYNHINGSGNNHIESELQNRTKTSNMRNGTGRNFHSSVHSYGKNSNHNHNGNGRNSRIRNNSFHSGSGDPGAFGKIGAMYNQNQYQYQYLNQYGKTKNKEGYRSSSGLNMSELALRIFG